MSNNETLKEALLRTGDADDLEHLSAEAQNLTKAHVTDFLNGNFHSDLSMGTMQSLRKFAKQRVIHGKSVFPFGSMEGVTHADTDDNMAGGWW
jgi:hypothetical protein